MNYVFLPVTARRRLMTLQEDVQTAAQQGRAVIPITGDCMEARDIMDGGWVAVDFTHYPRPCRRVDGKNIPGDPCVCYAQLPNNEDEPENPPAIMCKEYTGLWIGHMVATRYKQKSCKFRMNAGFSATAILGVVYASWGPDGRLLWETDPDTYPTELPSRITVKGGNAEAESTLVRAGVME